MDRRSHVKLDEALLGYTNENLHEWLDMTVKYLGSSHRQVKHGYKAIKWAEELFGEQGSPGWPFIFGNQTQQAGLPGAAGVFVIEWVRYRDKRPDVGAGATVLLNGG